MAQAIHLDIDELEARFRAAQDVVERTHCQVVWLLARGYTVADVSELVAMTPRWVNALARRYERDGIDALGDRRRHNHGARPLLSEADLEALRQRLATPPDDGGLWTSRKVADWIADRLGLAHVHTPRGWEALKKLKWSIQTPRPHNPKAATPEEQAAFKKSSTTRWRRRAPNIPTSRSKSGLPTSTGSA
jgi:transposase